jgi:hypothetical protein
MFYRNQTRRKKMEKKIRDHGKIVVFHDRVYDMPFKPYYDAYKGHMFTIDHEHHEDDTGEHVWVTCVTQPSLKVNGYVDRMDLVVLPDWLVEKIRQLEKSNSDLSWSVNRDRQGGV